MWITGVGLGEGVKVGVGGIGVRKPATPIVGVAVILGEGIGVDVGEGGGVRTASQPSKRSTMPNIKIRPPRMIIFFNNKEFTAGIISHSGRGSTRMN